MKDKIFKDAKAYVWKEAFAVVKSRKKIPGSFATVSDKNEITSVVDQSTLKKKDTIKTEKGWKIITFDMVLPFGLVGFLANISGALAKKGISIFVISSYSTDHILVKSENLDKSIKELKKLGFEISTI